MDWHCTNTKKTSPLPPSLAAVASNSQVTGLRCGNCQELLTPPYIECDVCPSVLRIIDSKIKITPVFVCLQCFSRGATFGTHKNSHDFAVIRNNFEILDKNWNASEELVFMEALRVCGAGNWETISVWLNGKKSARECLDHFNTIYTNNKSNECIKSTGLPYIDDLVDPPRPKLHSEAYTLMAGYNAARGDFDVEHDQTAESILSGVEVTKPDEKDTDRLFENLVHAVVGTYQTKLKERHRRKMIIKRHGLISENKSFIHMNRARAHLPPQLSKLFPKIHQLTNSRQLCELIESFKLEYELKDRVSSLQSYRHNGLTHESSAVMFEEMKEGHIASLRDRRSRFVVGAASTSTSNNQLMLAQDPALKRVSLPLDIVGRAGYDKLSEAERKLSSEIRLLPTDFIRFKNLMIADCKRLGGLSLAQARLLIKIDVNKTRKIYDQLLTSSDIRL